jgi:hypothetical protein
MFNVLNNAVSRVNSKTTKNPRLQDLNLELPEYEAGVLTFYRRVQ